MEPLHRFYLFLALFISATMAIPHQTSSITKAAASAVITPGPELQCSNGQTAVYTTDCTLGTPVSYCFSPEPPIECSQGFFPSVWHPGHCMEQSTCYPLNAPWITTECSNGGIPYTTSTLYQGTLAGGESTVISVVSCSCAANQWYSMTLLPGSSNYDTFCMPHSSCPPGMTTSVSINEYCATQPASVCSDIPLETDFCKCASTAQTPVYPDSPGATPTGCEF
ncbi:uncharacterized protein N7518_000422 [Penicillium psychrosexuale]|uniref:uncharacterized protein n=1 Tax=Penicillium psychrosexuale TaxID=1002107 RepID=UPI002545442E|nr:uncharacterized protein N7518_000422 [Penicillium psychrosexuale]KAJ5804119.1 hypothetical protein N7518_000422 [Penicillium psychrosexuale]